MSTLVVPNSELVKALGVETAVGGTWHSVTVHLFQNNITPGVTSVLADFTEATFTGYAGSASITWGLPNLSTPGEAQIAGDKKEFQPTDSVTPNTVYGWYGVGVGADSVNLKMAERFDTPAAAISPLDIVIVVPQIKMRAAGTSLVVED